MGDESSLKKIFSSERYAWLQAFLLALCISAIIFLPFVVMDKGLFFYYGDFNVQQIPFYQLVHRAVKSGDIFWNWYTDLGVNFIGSYSFYNLFSPFFWLTLPFPTSFLPYLMAPLLVLKTACAALTSCLYLSRFVQDKRYAVLGSLLYAFSGFTTYNIFFNHFHEVIVFFPLMLYALELLVADGRRGVFAITVAVNCMVNYWFFIGSVVFVVLYVIVRTVSRGWAMDWRKFFSLSLESVIGVLLACFALLPSVFAILGNPRTTADNILSGWGFWLYGHEQRQPAILESIFFPPDIPSRPNFLPDHGAKWASLSAWLPMIGPSFVIAYLLSTPRSWLKRMLYLCLLFAMVPGLNAAFILFNNSYYARWFYMPILMMSLASALALERYRTMRASVQLRRGVKITFIITLAYTLVIGFTPQEKEEGWVVGLMAYPERFWLYVAITLLGLLALWIIVRYLIDHPEFFRIMGASLGCLCVIYSVTMIALGRAHSNDREWMKEIAMDGADQLVLEETPGEFDRSDIYDNMDNLGMYWRLPNIQAFHSIVPVSLMEFYPSVGVKRDVSSKPQPEYYALRSLLSVKWLFVAEDEPEENQPSTPYFSYWDTQLGFNIYRNDNYLPMGFGYDRYMTREQYESYSETDRQKLLHRAILIEDEDINNIRQIIDPIPDSHLEDLSEEAYLRDIQRRRDFSSSEFYRDNRGFTSEITMQEDGIVFFSVPYDEGWSATVNGVPTKVLKVNGGFVGVPADAGHSTIRFDYLAPGLKLGGILTLAGALLLAAYLIVGRRCPLHVEAQPRPYPDLPAGAMQEVYPWQFAFEENPYYQARIDAAGQTEPGFIWNEDRTGPPPKELSAEERSAEDNGNNIAAHEEKREDASSSSPEDLPENRE